MTSVSGVVTIWSGYCDNGDENKVEELTKATDELTNNIEISKDEDEQCRQLSFFDDRENTVNLAARLVTIKNSKNKEVAQNARKLIVAIEALYNACYNKTNIDQIKKQADKVKDLLDRVITFERTPHHADIPVKFKYIKLPEDVCKNKNLLKGLTLKELVQVQTVSKAFLHLARLIMLDELDLAAVYKKLKSTEKIKNYFIHEWPELIIYNLIALFKLAQEARIKKNNDFKQIVKLIPKSTLIDKINAQNRYDNPYFRVGRYEINSFRDLNIRTLKELKDLFGKELKKLEIIGLQELFFSGTRDEELEILKLLGSVHTLNISRIKDRDLNLLENLVNLKNLWLNPVSLNDSITKEGLKYLCEKITQLTSITLGTYPYILPLMPPENYKDLMHEYLLELKKAFTNSETAKIIPGEWLSSLNNGKNLKSIKIINSLITDKDLDYLGDKSQLLSLTSLTLHYCKIADINSIIPLFNRLNLKMVELSCCPATKSLSDGTISLSEKTQKFLEKGIELKWVVEHDDVYRFKPLTS